MPPSAEPQPVHAGTLQRLLSHHAYFSGAPNDVFSQASERAALLHSDNAQVILEQGDTSPYAWFLIDGEVTLQSAASEPRTLTVEEPDAGFPIANLRPSLYQVSAAPGAKLVRLEQSFLRGMAKHPKPPRFLGGGETGGGSWQSHRFAVEVIRMQREGELKIPAMPGISAKVSNAMRDPDFAVTDLVKLLSADPAIAGELLKVSNSALFRGAAPCETLQAAIIRLGMQQTRILVLSLAARRMFSAKRDWIRKRLMQMWRHAVEIGAYASVLSRLDPRLDSAKSLLLGLLHEIGAVPVLELADQFPELEQAPGVVSAVLANTVPAYSAKILQEWELQDFAEAAVHQENWFYEHEGGPNYTDLLIVAHLHGLIKARRFSDLPRIDETPAYGQLGAAGLSASASVGILEEAQQELAELRSLLG